MSKNSTDSFKNALNNLIKARDEARVGLRLMSMDARKKWDELEAKAVELEGKLGQSAEQLTEKHAAAAEKLARTVEEFVNVHVRKIGGDKSTTA